MLVSLVSCTSCGWMRVFSFVRVDEEYDLATSDEHSTVEDVDSMAFTSLVTSSVVCLLPDA
jgi:hypothetical protein